MTEATHLQLIHSSALMAEGNASIATDSFARLEALAEKHHANLKLSQELQVVAGSLYSKAERARYSAFQARQLSRCYRRSGGTSSTVRQAQRLARMASLAATACTSLETAMNAAVEEAGA